MNKSLLSQKFFLNQIHHLDVVRMTGLEGGYFPPDRPT